MFNHNWLMWPAFTWLFLCYLAAGIDGQSEHAIGAHRVFEKTSFSCAGRPAGYYADIETGCQVYHMCDGLGRQFSYSCPNTTLFQQRMLICDHWYMVNCSRAESDYAANLLIGQRDKPFVNDDENSLRTPRPDLLDRPYAPDYSGESFRNQYKQLPAIQNQIPDLNAQKSLEKHLEPGQLAPGQQRWKIPPPSRTILPPAYEAQVSEESATQNDVNGVRFVPTTKAPTTRSTTKATTRSTTKAATRRTTTTAPATSRQQQVSSFSSAALQPRQPSETRPRTLAEHEDLGTSHSTRYNTSADFNSAEVPFIKTFNDMLNKKSHTAFSTTTTSSTTSTTVPIRVPSKIYEPPYLHPIYNENDTHVTENPLRISSATPFTASPIARNSATTTPIPPPSRPTTLAGKPFTAASFGASTVAPATANFGRSQNALVQPSFGHNHRFDVPKSVKDARTPTPAHGFKPPTPRPPKTSPKASPASEQSPESSPFDYKIPTTSQLHLPTPVLQSAAPNTEATLPAKELLPPFQEFVQHDIATTQGPPIYYEWKVPSNGLEPPKLDPPIGVDGREYPEAAVDYNTLGAADSDADQQKAPSSSAKTSAVHAGNPFLPTRAAATADDNGNDNAATSRSPTSRSIKETGQPNSVFRVNAGETTARAATTKAKAPTAAVPAAPSDITELRKELSVPEFAFPLESIGRTGYLSADAYNSFQLKLPERRADEVDEHLHWFGENAKCPECHPSFVVPGTCEPCLRR